MKILPVIGCCALLILASVNVTVTKPPTVQAKSVEPLQSQAPAEKQQAAVPEAPDNEVLDRLNEVEKLVQEHTQLVTDALTDTTPPIAVPVPAPSPGIPVVSHVAPEIHVASQDDPEPQGFTQVLQAAGEGPQAVLYRYGPEGWERVNELLDALTQAGIEHPHVVDLLEVSPEHRQIAELGVSEDTRRPWLQTLHEGGAYGAVWYPLDRIDSTATYEYWLRGNSQQSSNQGGQQLSGNYRYTYYPASIRSFNGCAT